MSDHDSARQNLLAQEGSHDAEFGAQPVRPLFMVSMLKCNRLISQHDVQHMEVDSCVAYFFASSAKSVGELWLGEVAKLVI